MDDANAKAPKWSKPFVLSKDKRVGSAIIPAGSAWRFRDSSDGVTRSFVWTTREPDPLGYPMGVMVEHRAIFIPRGDC